MARGRITAETLKALKRGPKDQFLWDDKLAGFGLKLTPAGRVVYLAQYRLGGRGHKTKRYTIGTSGELKPQQARDKAEALLSRVRDGMDIASEAKTRKRIATELAFTPFVRTFAKGTLKREWPKSWKQAQQCLEL
ncbi:MAG TPA: Arm DNA-binding domain-containing protein, partial [Sphingomicrobium sp.]|nr:Arm DNA-binding domain-containing protein [Sphingomicrobium sp.]